MDRLELYKELYFKELERKENISTRLQWTISLWVLIAGGILFCLNNAHKVPSRFDIAFNSTLIVSAVLLCCSTIWMGKCLWGKTVYYAPSPRDIDREYQNLATHYTQYPEFEHNIGIEFVKRLTDIYKRCATQISRNNNRTVSDVLKSTQLIVIAVLFLLISFSFMIPFFLKKEEPVNKIEIINDYELKNTDVYKIIIESR